MSWLAALPWVLAVSAAVAWAAERARRLRSRSASLRRESASAEAARAARDDAEARFRAALLDAGVGLAQVDARGTLLDCNDALARLLGAGRAALLGRPLDQAIQPGDRESFQLALGALVRGERDREAAERTFLRPDGGARRLRCTLAALRGEAGEFRSAIGLLEDVTERDALQARLADADRLAALGALAGGVAHELADPLAYVLGNLSFAREQLSGGAATPPEALAQARQALDEAHQGATRVGQVVGDLRALSRPGTGRLEPVDAAAALRAAFRLAEGTLRGRARASLEVVPAPPVLGDPARLGQALLGLLLDAVNALPPGQEAGHLVRLELAPEADGRVRVAVEVHGPGPEAAPAPAAAAAAGWGADGLGLAAARRAVEAMGGELALAAAPGLRTATVRLAVAPRADRLSPAGPAPAAPEAGPRGRVLVVDDEPYVGKTLRRILGQAHDVEVVASGEAALERLAAGPLPDVILCDLMMPGMTGMALHAELVARAPAAAARVIFVTGGAVQEGPRRFLEAVANPVLEKPLSPDLLRRVVAESVRRGVAALPPDLVTPSI